MIILIIVFSTGIIRANLKQYPIADWQIQNEKKMFIAQGFLMPVLKNIESFDQKNIVSLSAYKRSFIKAAAKKGISADELLGAFNSVDKTGNSIKIPVNIQTIRYNNEDAYFITYKYTYDNSFKTIPWFVKKKMPFYIMCAIVEKGSNKLLQLN